MKRRKQKPSSESATGRSGLPSPAATESPRPAINRSRTTISVVARCGGPSGTAAAAVGLGGHLLLGGEHGFQIERRDVAEKILLAPEQAEAVLHLPDDAQILRDRRRQD